MRDHRGRIPHVGVATILLVCAALLDLDVINLHSATGLVMLAELAVLAVSARLVDRLSRAGRLLVAAGVAGSAAVLSGAVTWFLYDTVLQRTPGMVGLVALLLMMAALCRRLPPWLLVFVLPPLVALAALGWRLPAEPSWLPLGDVSLVLALLGAAAGAWGFVQRVEDGRQRAARQLARQAERLELARDLHDDVAHHVTAMIVVAQAGEQLAERDPAQARQLFADLERTGQDGLVAMSRMVRLLRSEGRPEMSMVGTLDTVRDQVETFARGGTRTELKLGPGVDEHRWPPELAKSVQRLVQEGLTNVRKHARTATAVQVCIEHDDGGLVVRVRDDGAGVGRGRFRPSGFGMVGLAERVSALGGELAGGPVDGGGWQLVARLPHPADVR